MRKGRHILRAFHSRLSTKVLLFAFLSFCRIAFFEVNAQTGQENLKLAYESAEEGNEHQDAIASVEAGLGGNGENSDDLRVVEQESSALLKNLREILPKPKLAENVVSLSSDLLHDLKVQALARLEKKVRAELEKETAALGPTVNEDNSPNPAAHIYRIVKQNLSFLSWVRIHFTLRIYSLTSIRMRILCFYCAVVLTSDL